MPNWCENRLKISGPVEAIAAFKAAAAGTEGGEAVVFSLQSLLPCPQELLDTVRGFMGAGTPKQIALEAKQKENLARFGFEDWYGWKLQNWGCKWDVDARGWDCEEDTYLETFFDSPWSPPAAAIAGIAALWPDLEFFLDYAEGGCDFAGCMRAKGETFSETCGDYSMRAECFHWGEEDEGDEEAQGEEEKDPVASEG